MRTANAVAIAGGAVSVALIDVLIESKFLAPDNARAILAEAKTRLQSDAVPPGRKVLQWPIPAHPFYLDPEDASDSEMTARVRLLTGGRWWHLWEECARGRSSSAINLRRRLMACYHPIGAQMTAYTRLRGSLTALMPNNVSRDRILELARCGNSAIKRVATVPGSRCADGLSGSVAINAANLWVAVSSGN